MNEALLGEKIDLEARDEDAFVRLAVGAAKDFLQAADGSARDLEATEEELRERARPLLQDGHRALHARLVLVREGVEIYLWPAGSDPDSGTMVLCRA